MSVAVFVGVAATVKYLTYYKDIKRIYNWQIDQLYSIAYIFVQAIVTSTDA